MILCHSYNCKKNKTCSANNYAVKDKDYFVYKAAKKGKVTIQVSLPDSGYWNVCVYNQKRSWSNRKIMHRPDRSLP